MNIVRGFFVDSTGFTYDLGNFTNKDEGKAWIRAFQICPRDGDGFMPHGKIVFG